MYILGPQEGKVQTATSEKQFDSELNIARVKRRSECAKAAGRQVLPSFDPDIADTQIAEAEHAVCIAIHIFEIDSIEEIESIECQLNRSRAVGIDAARDVEWRTGMRRQDG